MSFKKLVLIPMFMILSTGMPILADETDIQKSPAKYSITGRIRMQPVTVRSILPKSFDIPFKLSSNNIRTDD